MLRLFVYLRVGSEHLGTLQGTLSPWETIDMREKVSGDAAAARGDRQVCQGQGVSRLPRCCILHMGIVTVSALDLCMRNGRYHSPFWVEREPRRLTRCEHEAWGRPSPHQWTGAATRHQVASLAVWWPDHHNTGEHVGQFAQHTGGGVR